MENSLSPTNQPTTTRTWTVSEVRRLLKSLITNRKRSWQTANFLLHTKLRALKTFEINFEAAEGWGIEGHAKLIYNQRENIREILPGENSRFTRLKNNVEDLLFGVEQHFNNQAQ
ncbi:hypothetical protein [Roseivirga seohaensis]|uniref:hypothetical protein n=1 Tax=Roseivirga seohaensis TaxID=1914963 RepID=UPI003BAD3A0F